MRGVTHLRQKETTETQRTQRNTEKALKTPPNSVLSVSPWLEIDGTA